MRLTVALWVSLVSGAAFAQGGGQQPPVANSCKTIMKACEAAGYHHGGHGEHKGLWKDCAAPILDGKAIDGVTVNPDDVKDCAAHRPAHRG
ncbi:MAG TPA: hypothetical protein VIA18_18495 [Polyangia bacterium]|jgi:hypothetical protein|nr:hypothetical protein [Polyangia bacterium]